MSKYKSIYTNYNRGDVVSTGLTLAGAVKKVVSNIYGYDEDISFIEKSIKEDCNSKFGATFFCSKNTGQISIKADK